MATPETPTRVLGVGGTIKSPPGDKRGKKKKEVWKKIRDWECRGVFPGTLLKMGGRSRGSEKI